MLSVIYKLGIIYIVMSVVHSKFTDGKPSPLDSNENPTPYEQTLTAPEPPKVEERHHEVTETMGWDTWKIIDPLENGFINEREFGDGNMHFIEKRVLPYSKDQTYA